MGIQFRCHNLGHSSWLGSSTPGSIIRRLSVCSWAANSLHHTFLMFFSLRSGSGTKLQHPLHDGLLDRRTDGEDAHFPWGCLPRRILAMVCPQPSRGSATRKIWTYTSCHPKISNKKVSGIPYFEFRFRYWFWVTSVFFLPRLKLKLIFEPFNLTKQLHTWSLLKLKYARSYSQGSYPINLKATCHVPRISIWCNP